MLFVIRFSDCCLNFMSLFVHNIFNISQAFLTECCLNFMSLFVHNIFNISDAFLTVV